MSKQPYLHLSFQKTNQTQFLNSDNLPAVLSGIRSICGIASTVLGNVSETDGEATPSSSAVVPAATTGTVTNQAGVLALLNPAALTLVTGAILVIQGCL